MQSVSTMNNVSRTSATWVSVLLRTNRGAMAPAVMRAALPAPWRTEPLMRWSQTGVMAMCAVKGDAVNVHPTKSVFEVRRLIAAFLTLIYGQVSCDAVIPQPTFTTPGPPGRTQALIQTERSLWCRLFHPMLTKRTPPLRAPHLPHPAPVPAANGRPASSAGFSDAKTTPTAIRAFVIA